MTRVPYSDGAVPRFDAAPSVILIAGELDFLVEEAAARAAESLSRDGVERLRFDDDASPEAISDALLNRSLFSPRRLVELDATRLFGSDAPAELYRKAIEGWEKETPAGRRDAFRGVRALLSALGIERGSDAIETAEAVLRRLRRKEAPEVLASVLRDLPEEKAAPRLLEPALRTILERGNDGVVALLTAIAPPSGVELFQAIARAGLVLTVEVDEKTSRPALVRYARVRAAEREIAIDPDAIDRLTARTNENPAAFAAELAKLFDWAGKGGRIRAADVRATVADEDSEDIYAFFDALGRRDAADALGRLERLLSGREIRLGDKRDRNIEPDDAWPFQVLGMLSGEIRRMLLLRSALAEVPGFDPRMRYDDFEARIAPRLEEPVAPFGEPLFAIPKKKFGAFALFKSAQRAARYQPEELARALARSAALDVELKTSAPVLEAFTAYVGRMIAGS